MHSTVSLIILLIVLVGLGTVVVALYAAGIIGKGGGELGIDSNERLRMLVSSQRQADSSQQGGNLSKVLAEKDFEEQSLPKRKMTSIFALSLDRKLWYSKWKITPLQFRVIQLSSCAFAGIVAGLSVPGPMAAGMTVNALFIAYTISNGLLDLAVQRRSNAFDSDYATMLMSFVSLLKTGMNPIGALEQVAVSLDQGCLVRQELEILVERLRLGLSEEQALAAFAEDILHPEIELFIQVLTLNMRVGGKLSSALERLVKQVRKRQEFKKKAIAAVAMERGSIWAILGIMTLLFVVMWMLEPRLIDGVFQTPSGQTFFPWCVFLTLLGVVWSRKVTKINM